MLDDRLEVLKLEFAKLKPDVARTGSSRAKQIEGIIAKAKMLQEQIEERLADMQKLLGRAGIELFADRVDRIVAELKTAEGGAFTGAELATKFQLTASVLHRRRREHRVIFWRDPQHENRYPRWQFNEAGALLPGIQEVLQAFESFDEWRVMRYFLGPRKQLGGKRPLDLLRNGDIETVVNHARTHAAENTW